MSTSKLLCCPRRPIFDWRSCSFFFWLYLSYGETVIEYVKRGNMVIFGLALVVVTVVMIRKRRAARALADQERSG